MLAMVRDGLGGPARLAVIEGGTHASNMSHPAEVSAEMLAFLRHSVTELHQSIVMVTHDARGAAYADRVVFLADGNIVDELHSPTADSVLERMKLLGG